MHEAQIQMSDLDRSSSFSETAKGVQSSMVALFENYEIEISKNKQIRKKKLDAENDTLY